MQREALPWLFHDGRGEFPSETYISGLIEREDVALFVAASRDALVGTVTVRSMRPPDFPSLVPHAYASVDSLVVLPEWRQRGIATALMGVCEERAREWGATRIELVVYEFNDAAQVLYERLGYETLSRRLTRHL